MSRTIEDARQQFVDERLAELQELCDRRNDFLREMFHLVQYGEGSSTSLLSDEEDIDVEELERFLERFDLRKNLQTGTIMTLELPELKLKTDASSGPSPSVENEIPSTEVGQDSDELKYLEEEEEELQYPTTSPLSSRTQKPEAEVETRAADVAMDVDVRVEVDELPGQEAREESPVNPEEDEASEQQAEPRTPPRTRARTRTSSPIAPKRRKRRRSELSSEIEPADDTETLHGPTRGHRRTRSKSRKFTTPSPAAQVTEDDDVDELDIISLSSPSNVSPPRRRASMRKVPSASVPPVTVSVDEDTVEGEHLDKEDEVEAVVLSKSIDVVEQQPSDEVKYVPPSPSTPSARSASKSPILQVPPPEPREAPIRAPRPRLPQIVDTTPLTPPRSPPPPIVVRLPLQQPENPVYRFAEESSTSQVNEPEIKIENEPTLPAIESERPRTSSIELKVAKRPLFNYALPPLSALPPEFNRKGKPQKSRRRDKERERSGSDPGRRDDWVPLGMSKWAAMLYANPAHKKLGRATKCVTTKDWNTASTELKLIRTLERVDVLKRTGKWSFRQLKKQRVAAGLVKTHWDYLMDEMKWMQTDFREERRWKIALAYELALCVQEWHEAGSYEERLRLGICSLWTRPEPLEMASIDDEHQPMEVDIVPPPVSEDGEQDAAAPEDMQEQMHAVDIHVSDNEDDDVEDQRAVTAALIPDITVVNVTEDDHQAFSVPDATETPSITMKLEDVEGADVLHLTERIDGENKQDALQLPQGADDLWAELPKTEVLDASQALKDTSNDPPMDSQPEASAPDPEMAQKEQKSLWSPEQTKTLRSAVLSLPEDTLFVSMDQFVQISDEELLKSLAPEGVSDDTHLNFDLTMVFPELQPFSMIDVATSEIVSNTSDGRRKGDKKADKDDPTKRVEETTYTKLCPTSRFAYMKPTLVSALQPARKWRKGKWIDLDESPVVSDVDSPPPISGSENGCTLFEGRRISIPFQPPLMLHNFSKLARNTVKTAEIPWSQAEDNLLKSLAERYPSNWRLVADALNSSRIRTSIDLRTPQECFERWRTKCGLPTRLMIPSNTQHAGLLISNEEGTAPNTATGVDSGPPPASAVSATTSQMTTRGIKRMATSAAQNSSNLSVSTGAATVESRKRKRHMIIYEAVRKTLARRQKQRKQDELKYQTSNATVAPVHDTHNQFGTKTIYTPLELSKMKADRERKEIELQLHRRREMESKRQQQQQQLQAHIQQQQQAQQQQQQQQSQQQIGQQGVALPQNVPQIRTQVGISQHQQQKLPTQVASAPISPQMMQAQAVQQARALAQAQVQTQQTQTSHPQLQGQMATAQNMNGAVPHLSAQYAANHGGAVSPVAQQSSPPRSVTTPVNSVSVFPRPSSAQRNVSMPGTQVLPMANGSVPIARTNNPLAAYFANSGVQYTAEQMTQLMRYQQAQQAAQQQQLQMQQQQQQPVQMQMPTGQQNSHQGSMTGYPPTGQ